MRKLHAFTIFVLLIAFSFTSCEETQTTSSIVLKLTQEVNNSSRSIFPEDTPLDVTQYSITGNGPTEKDYFNVNTKDNKTTIEGLSVGKWDLFAVGKNIDGLLLVSGSTEIEVNQNQATAEIELNKLVGNGNIKITFMWNSELTTNPKLELELCSYDSKKTKVKPTTIDYSQGIATFETVAKANSYTFKAKLYEGDVLLAGCNEAIRVVMNKTSEGVVNFNINDTAPHVGDVPITINNKMGVPITCHIEDIAPTVAFNQEIFPTLKEESNLPLNDFSIEWYLDGALIGSGINCSFKPKIGFHRLDVIVNNGSIGGTSSAYKEFEVKVNAPAYIPKVVSSINNGDNGFYAGANMHVCFLPDKKIISYCGETHTLQICRLINNSIEVIKTYNNSYDMPLSNVIDMKVDETRNRVFISEQSTNTITIYDYAYNKLTKYYSDSRYDQYARHFGHIFLRPKDFLIFDHIGDSYREYKIEPDLNDTFFSIAMVQKPDDINYHCSKGLMSPNLDSVAFASDTGYISLAYNKPGFNNCLLRPTAPLQYNPKEILVAGALDWDTFIAGAHNRIIVGSLIDDGTNYSSTLAEKKTYLSASNKLPAFSEVCNFIYYLGYDNFNNLNTLEKVYALCKGSNSLLVFNVDRDTFNLTYIGKEDLFDFSPTNGVLSKDNKTLILTGENEKCIKICKIHQ